jgi:hypothetical protein
MQKRHCDRCDDLTGDRDYYVVSVTRCDKLKGVEIKTHEPVELCERCWNDVKRRLAEAPARAA